VLKFNMEKHKNEQNLGYAKLGESGRQFDEKQKNEGGKNKTTSVYVGRNRDGSHRFVDLSQGSYDSAAGDMWRIMQSNYPDLEKRFRDWVTGEAEKNPDQFDNDQLRSIWGGGSVQQLKTSKNILNFAKAIGDQDVYDFFIAMAGQGNTSGGGPVPGVSRAGTPVSRYYDAYMGGGNRPQLFDPNFK